MSVWEWLSERRILTAFRDKKQLKERLFEPREKTEKTEAKKPKKKENEKTSGAKKKKIPLRSDKSPLPSLSFDPRRPATVGPWHYLDPLADRGTRWRERK